MADNRNIFKKAIDWFNYIKCPNCLHHGGKVIEDKFIESETFLGSEEQEEKHYDQLGKLTGSTRRRVQVWKRRDFYWTDYHCKLCGHTWKIKTKQVVTL